MTLHTKTLAGVPSVSLIESPSAGIKTKQFGFSKDPFHERERLSYKDSLFKYIGACIDRTSEQSNFMTCDLTEAMRRYNNWTQELPRVAPFYAVKCNTDLPLLKVLGACGVNFDCASKSEIETVMKIGADPTRIIFANACKFSRDIRFAAKAGVRRTTFDNELELTKLAKDWPDVECVLRILPRIYDAQCQLSDKFGASVDIVPSLLAKAQELDLNVVGISFHVGSGCYEARAWAESVRLAKQVANSFDRYGFTMKFLDIGGGFPGNSVDLGQRDQPTFLGITSHLREALDEAFPIESGVEIIAEPGRYFASSLYTAVTEVYGKRVVSEDGEKVNQVYIGDGVYGSFNNVIFDHQKVLLSAVITPDAITRRGNKTESDSYQETATLKDTVFGITNENKYIRNMSVQELSTKHQSVMSEDVAQKTKIFGPTCDGIDTLDLESVPELSYGDWLVWRDMGAYTISAASRFNGMPKPKLYYFLYEPTDKQMKVIRKALELGEPKEDIPLSSMVFIK